MADDFREAIGKRIYEKRKALQLSQEALAEKADTTKQTISAAENGKRELTAHTISRLARALESSTDYLINGRYTNDDVLMLNQRITGLSDIQLQFLEKLIRNFVEMCDTDDT